jgi:monoamine oxidase
VLADAGLQVLVLEARDRAGGRAWTDASDFGYALDMGCQWLHSADRNPMVELALGHGYTVIERDPGWGSLAARHLLDARQLRECEAYMDASMARVREAGERGHDVPVASLIDTASPYASFFRAVITWMTSGEASRVSSLDLARYRDSGHDWPILEGYGTLVAALADGLAVQMNAAVTAIDWSQPIVEVQCAAGTLEAHAVIVTVPTAVLAAQAIRFDPPLPHDKTAALESLPLGVVNKVWIQAERDPFGLPADSFLLGSLATSQTGVYHVYPFGWPLLQCFMAGDIAAALEAEGPQAMHAYALGELLALFGTSLRKKLGAWRTTAWGADPYARGAYSHALPGAADARLRLGAPLADRIYFAGEACSVDAAATAHGAWLNGREAAHVLINRNARGTAADNRTRPSVSAQ